MPNPICPAVAVAAAVALLTLAAIPAAARTGPPPPQTHKQVEDDIWGKERAIYAAR